MDKFIAEHSYMFYIANTILILLIGWLVRKLFASILDEWKQAIHAAKKDIEKACNSITDLYNKYNDHEHRLSNIEGEHRVLSQIHKADQ